MCFVRLSGQTAIFPRAALTSLVLVMRGTNISINMIQVNVTVSYFAASLRLTKDERSLPGYSQSGKLF